MSPSEAGLRTRGREVGRVAALWRYPVKSMAAEPLDAVDVSWNGLAGDRRWAFVRDGMDAQRLPLADDPRAAGDGPLPPPLRRAGSPDGSPILVRTPSGHELDVVDPALAAELGSGVRVLKQDRGVFDTMPLSLITTRTIAGLGALVGAELDVRRFRPNLLVEATDGGPSPRTPGWGRC